MAAVEKTFWVNRDEYPAVLMRVSDALGLSLAKDYPATIDDNALDDTWPRGGPWLCVEHRGPAETQLFLAADECWGIVFYVVCDESLVPALSAVIPHYR